MKKVLSFLLLITLCLSMILTSTSCDFKKSAHPIDEFNDTMNSADSYQIAMTMSNVPFLGTITIITQIDGDIQYTPATFLSAEEYIHTVGDTEHVYTKDEETGTWSKTERAVDDSDDSSDFSSAESMEDFFNSKNFEKVKGEENTYKQKSSTSFDEYDNVKIKISDSSYTITMTVTSDGMTMDAEIVISKINDITLTLPSVN